MATDIAQHVEDLTPDLGEDDLIAGLDRFREWAHSDYYPEHGKFSYVQGVLDGEMSPESLHEHNYVKGRLTVTLGSLLDELQCGQLYMDGSLFVNESVGVATEPDIMFCKWDTLQSGRVKLQSYKKSTKGTVEVHGTPDLMIEIISPSSVVKDKVRLKKAYFECGIPEYWLIDARGSKLDFKLFVRGATEFISTTQHSDGYLFSPFFNRAFRLERTPHPLVNFQYQLLHRTTGDT